MVKFGITNGQAMEFRETAWAQQLFHMRLLHGPGAEATERSLPNYPPAALREVLRQSQHPHNIEPLLLTLARPVNAPTRLRFASVGGELVLVQKVLSKDPVASDLQVAVHGQVIQAADGILYPTKDVSTPYETWVRVEMLEVLRVMINEGIVKSLVPEMQQKLVDDLLQLTSDVQQHELIRLYALLAATAAIKQFHTLRPAIVASQGYLPKVSEYLEHVLQQHTSSSIYIDPFEHMKALHACVEALYLLSVGRNSHGDPNLKLDSVLKDSSTVTSLDNIQSLYPDLLPVLDPGLAPVLSSAIQQAWSLLHDRDCFEPLKDKPAKQQQEQQQPDGDAAAAAKDGEADVAAAAKEEQQEEEIGEQSFEDNWQMFLKTGYDKDLLPSMGKTTIALAAALLQLMTLQVINKPFEVGCRLGPLRPRMSRLCSNGYLCSFLAACRKKSYQNFLVELCTGTGFAQNLCCVPNIDHAVQALQVVSCTKLSVICDTC